MILCGNPKAQYLAHRQEIDAAMRRVLESGRYILGPEVEAFEAEFAAYIGVRHAIGVGSGTDALELALRASGIGDGDEVITIAHTAVATVAAIELAGAVPVFADIAPDGESLDPELVERLVSPRTRAVLPVHLYGQAAEMEPLMALANRHDLRVIEDCAQAHGATLGARRLGSIGQLGCFSFYPTKNLGAIGDGGMVVTDDDALAESCRSLREYGWKERYVSHEPGKNTRLDELQAAILRVKLRALDEDNARRGKLAELYISGLGDLGWTLPRPRLDRTHVYHLFVLRVPEKRDALLEHLRGAGIGAAIHYPVPVHLQKAYAGRIRGSDALSNTERAAREVLSLPIYPELEVADIERVIAAVRSFEERP